MSEDVSSSQKNSNPDSNYEDLNLQASDEREPHPIQEDQSKLSLRGIAKAIAAAPSSYIEKRAERKKQEESLPGYNPKKHRADLRRDRKLYKNMDNAVSNSVIRSVYSTSIHDTGFPLDESELKATTTPATSKSVTRRYQSNAEAINKRLKVNRKSDEKKSSTITKDDTPSEVAPNKSDEITSQILEEAHMMNQRFDDQKNKEKEQSEQERESQARIEKLVSFIETADVSLNKIISVAVKRGHVGLIDLQRLLSQGKTEPTLPEAKKTAEVLQRAGIIEARSTYGVWKSLISAPEYLSALDVIANGQTVSQENNNSLEEQPASEPEAESLVESTENGPQFKSKTNLDQSTLHSIQNDIDEVIKSDLEMALESKIEQTGNPDASLSFKERSAIIGEVMWNIAMDEAVKKLDVEEDDEDSKKRLGGLILDDLEMLKKVESEHSNDSAAD